MLDTPRFDLPHFFVADASPDCGMARIREPKYRTGVRAEPARTQDSEEGETWNGERKRMKEQIKPPVKRVELLSKELLVAREIYGATIVEHQNPMYFNRLVERMKGRKLASRATVSFALDMLFDQGIVRAEWSRTKDGKHVRGLTIAGEAEKFVKAIYDATT